MKKPVALWLDYELSIDTRKPVRTLTVILRTTGCQWRKCRMCGYWHESSPSVTQADILDQLRYALTTASPPNEDFILKLYTSGSFLDEREISSVTRRRIAQMLRQRRDVKKLIIETRPEYVNADALADLAHVELEVAMGLETADDFIRLEYIDKGFSFEDYKAAARLITDCGVTVKTYLLLKPPFVSERAAIEDVIKSAERVAQYSPIISLNLCNVQRHTRLEELWRRGYYRPPWLWSAVEAMKRIKEKSPHILLISDPVGAGQVRGPHNCGYCDKTVMEAIKRFNITQDSGILKGLNCDCRDRWQLIREFDDYLSGAIL